MRAYNKHLEFRTRELSEIIDITAHVEQAARHSGVKEGLALVFPMHTSSAVYLSDSDRSLTLDFADLLEALVPESREYRHNQTDYKKNAAGHLKAILSGHSVTLPVTNGALDLGIYQTIYYFEFDGQRPKKILIKIIGE
ncbi:MAG: secondary thiamine-phosphate synthase enzyme YjbQ [Candidatus Sumerlaeota bacterium]|nr:secondary thiamine-phosphate synthase enzyme YjbQ [Candidatus Sumerlaeota bacterium]